MTAVHAFQLADYRSTTFSTGNWYVMQSVMQGTQFIQTSLHPSDVSILLYNIYRSILMQLVRDYGLMVKLSCYALDW